MARSAAKMAVAALLVLAVAAATAEARNIKTAEKKDDAVVEPTTFPPFDRLGGGASPAFGGLPGGSSMPGFSMPGGLTPGFGSMPLFGGGSPGFSGFGGLPGPAAGGSVPEHAKKP